MERVLVASERAAWVWWRIGFRGSRRRRGLGFGGKLRRLGAVQVLDGLAAESWKVESAERHIRCER